jgi:hypothetical protein
MLHPSLPHTLTPENLAAWLQQNSKERTTLNREYRYTEDELDHFKTRAMNCGIEINDLNDEKKRINELIEKGISDFTQIDLLPSKGLKQLKIERLACEKEVKRGYQPESLTIYGIPNHDTHNMDYFDIEGNEIVERQRPLTAKETREYVAQMGVFNQDRKVS